MTTAIGLLPFVQVSDCKVGETYYVDSEDGSHSYPMMFVKVPKIRDIIRNIAAYVFAADGIPTRRLCGTDKVCLYVEPSKVS